MRLPHDASWVGIIDDDASVRSALARALRGDGISVRTFGSAEEFLFRAAESDPECIVLDIQLGELSGLDLHRLLAARGTKVPVIFISAHDDLLLQCEGVHDACGYLHKPFDTGALIALLRPHLRSSVGE
jgi:FixJ family two-component response regulator